MMKVDELESAQIRSRQGGCDEAPDLKQLAQCYDRRYSRDYCRKHQGRHYGQLRTLLRCVPALGACTRVLDYGCGSAACTELLKEAFPHSEIYGIDISGEAIKTAQVRFPDCYYSVFDGGAAPFQTQRFDVIFSSHVLEHVLDLSQTLKDMSRLLRPGGYLCVTLPCANEGSLEWRLTVKMKDAIVQSPTGEWKWCWEDPTHLRRLASKELIRGFTEEGLTLKKSFFGNQFWGGVEGVCLCGPGMVLKWLQVSRGIKSRDRITLAWAKLLLLGISPIYFTKINLWQKSKQVSGLKRWLCFGVMPLKLVYWPIAMLVRSLADNEWNKRRFNSDGASQFLVFQKGVGAE